MSTHYIEAVKDTEQDIENFCGLFLNSLSLTLENIKSLDDIELERNFIAATYLSPNKMISFNRDYDNLYNNLEREYMDAVQEHNVNYANDCKEAISRLLNIKPNLEKMINLFHLLPALVVEKNNRNK